MGSNYTSITLITITPFYNLIKNMIFIDPTIKLYLHIITIVCAKFY